MNEKQQLFAKIAANYYKKLATQSYGVDRTVNERSARRWLDGHYHFRCLDCGGEDCACCEFYHEGSKFECDSIIAAYRENIEKELELLDSLEKGCMDD